MLPDSDNNYKLPFFPQEEVEWPNARNIALTPTRISMSMQKDLFRLFPNYSLEEILITLWVVYLLRSGNDTASIIGFQESDKKMRPLDIAFNTNIPFNKALQLVRDCLRKTNKKSLTHHLHKTSIVPPIAIIINTKLKQYKLESGNVLGFVIKPGGKQFNVIYKLNLNSLCIEVIKAIPKHIVLLLQEVIANPDRYVSKLSMLTQEEREKVFFTWNGVKKSLSNFSSVQSIFEDHTRKNPDNIAIEFGDDKITYKKLNQDTNRLAHYLCKIYVKKYPGVPIKGAIIGLAIPRSMEMIMAMLAIIKSGAAYVYLDTEYPKSRLQYILKDTQLKIILTLKDVWKKLPFFANNSRQVVCIDNNWNNIAKSSSVNPKHINVSDDLIYVIYTSGSTGKPKGVLIEHIGVIRLLKRTNFVKITKYDCFAQINSPSFDVSAFEIWGALLHGARIILPVDLAIITDSQLFYNFVHSNKITHLSLTTSLYHALAKQDNTIFRHLDYLIVAGEALNKTIADLQTSLPKALKPNNFINAYGPTEATVYASTYNIKTIDHNLTTIPIGKPISNTSCYVLDSNLEPTSVGVTGELHIGGKGLAAGYLNAPQLTSQKFIKSPFEFENRLYKSGDFVRWLPDGNLEFLGRIDDQVKIRGFRIELGEVESAIMSFPEIKLCKAVVYEKNTQKQLVAYYEPASDKARLITTEEWVLGLRKKLPDFMIPAIFIPLKKMPLTTSGKINKKLLPSPDQFARGKFIAPRNEVEQIIANTWTEALGIKDIGIHDNYFSLGGQSLNGMQVVLKLRDFFSIQCTVRLLFENPTIAQLAEVIQKKLTGERMTFAAIKAVDHKKPLPLSFSQLRLWFLNEYGVAEKPPYNEPFAMQINGDLKVKVLEKSINYLIQRHESLRTVFKYIEGEAKQLILPKLQIKLAAKSITSNYQLIRLLKKYAAQKFDFSRGLLWRVKLFKLNKHKYALLFCFHHIIVDGWSINIFFNELNKVYNAYLNNAQPILPKLTIQYADFAVWQRKHYKRSIEHIEYWKTKLDNFKVLNLPTDFPRPPVQTYNGKHYQFLLDTQLTVEMRTLCANINVSLFMLLAAVFNILLSRYSGQKDIVIGVPAANRNYSHVENVIGFFINTLALRNDLTNHATFNDFLQAVKQTSLDAYTYQDVPFEQVVEKVVSVRDVSRNPLFQVMLVLQNIEETIELDFVNTTSDRINFGYDIAKFDLMFNFFITKRGLACQIEYNTDLYRSATIRRMAKHFVTVLTAVTADYKCELDSIPIMTKDELDMILHTWNDTATPYPKTKTIQQLFESQARKTPTHIAAVFQSNCFTYKQLNDRANQLARYIRRLYHLAQDRKITTDTFIGLYCNKNLEMVLGILAILKAGGVYVPLNPNFPIERLKFIQQDIKLNIILSTQALVDKSPYAFLKNITKICIDSEHSKIDRYSTKNLTLINKPSSLAYVIYTSGSTGVPKGVLLEHKTITNLIAWQKEYDLQFVQHDKQHVTQFADIGFDVSLQEIFGALLNGHELHIIAADDRKSLPDFINYIKNNRIDKIFIPTALLEYLTTEALTSQNLFLQLKEIIVAGEALKITSNIRKFFKTNSQIALVNHYGPSETHVVTAYSMLNNADTWNELPSIGRPIDNTKIYILDAAMQPVPVGVPGEIYIAGVGVARGYLNQPKLNKEKFLPNPLLSNNNNNYLRLYKTGDLACWLSDGNISFIGRNDDQVKIRGYRIELGEIESRILQNKSIRQCVVTVYVKNGDQQLVAYYQLKRKSEKVDPDALKVFLSEQLPDYMIPAYFMLLDTFPLTASGKINKKLLPELSKVVSKTYEAPKTASEKKMATVWSSVLNVKQIGLNDNFFSLGGHSLSAIKLSYAITQEFNINVPVRNIFEAPTIKLLCAKLFTKKMETFKWPIIVPDEKNSTIPFPLTDVQYAYWVGRKNLFQLGNISTHCYYEFDFSDLDIVRMEKALNLLIERHDMLRVIIQEDGKQKVLANVGNYKITIQDLRKLTGRQINSKLKAWRDELAQQIFDTEKWPLFDFRVTILADKYRFHISFDALIFDAHSLQIFLSEWTQLYRDLNTELPKLALHFRDYVLAYNNLKLGKRYERDKKYWTNRLPNMATSPQLVLLRHPESVKQPKFNRLTTTVDSLVWHQLKDKTKSHNINPTSVLLYAYGAILARWSKSSDSFLINLTLFNRLPLHSQVNDIIGDFTTLELFEFNSKDCTADNAIIKGIKRVQNLLLDDLEHILFGGIAVLRKLAEMHKKPFGGLAPVVFTSVLSADVFNERELFSGSYIGSPYGITQTSQVWLDNKVYEEDDALLVEWDYVEDLFSKEMITVMHEAYCDLITKLSMLDWEQQLPQILPQTTLELIEHVNSAIRPIADKCLYELFLGSAKQTPQKLAVVNLTEQRNYKQLYIHVNQLAHALKHYGAKPNKLIAILMRKGWQQAIAALGIMQSGAAYLPLDISWPLPRIQAILKQGMVDIVVTEDAVLSDLDKDFVRSNKKIRYLSIDNRKLLNKYLRTPLPRQQKLTDIAYVIFTSGSTGNPKGVVISHKSAVNTVLDINDRFNISSNDCVFALSKLSFDLSVYDIFGMLASGATIAYPDDALQKDPGHWIQVLISKQVTVWNTVPMLMQMLVDYALQLPEKIQSILGKYLRLVLLSGDWIPIQLPDKIRKVFPKAQVISLGGATEGAIWSIIYPIDKVNPTWLSIPYGKAMANQQMYILDKELNYCPINVPGMIFIGGIGIAKGYWRNKSEINKSFIIDPKTNQRLYNTGDLGKLLPDGNIELLGREDTLVKINGYRVELGEIEHALRELLALKDALVEAVGNKFQDKKLVAYVIRTNEQESVFHANLCTVEEQLAFKKEDLKIRKQYLLPLKYKLQGGEFTKQRVARYFARKSYKHFLDKSIDKETIEKCLQGARPPIHDYVDGSFIERLGHLLGNLQAYREKGLLFPKYLYPSAGALYPIQTYLSIATDEINGLGLGFYYYHPYQHCLIKIDTQEILVDHTDKAPIKLHFATKIDAIKPIYGNRALEFSEIEFGYLSSLLKYKSHQVGIELVKTSLLTEPHQTLKLNDTDVYFNSFAVADVGISNKKLLAIKQISPTALEKNKHVHIYVYIKPSRIIGVKGGLYEWNKQKLVYIADCHPRTPGFGQSGGNGNLIADAAAIISFRGKAAKNNFIEIGDYAQGVVDSAIALDIGSCAMGCVIGETGLEPYMQGVFMHSVALGLISAEQKRSHEYSEESVYYIKGLRMDKSLASTLKNSLEQKLPPYMVPNIYIKMEQFPLSPNGKIDRKALPKPVKGEVVAISKLIYPRDSLEFAIQKIWKELLKVDTASINENFFILGGNSLKAVYLVTKINGFFNTNYSVSWIYKHSTIEKQAAVIREKNIRPAYDPVLRFNEQPEKEPLIFVHPGIAGAEAYLELAACLDKKQPFYAIDSYNLYSGNAPIKSIKKLAALYIKHLKRVIPNGPYYLGGWSLGGMLAHEMACQLTKRGQRVKMVYLLDSFCFAPSDRPQMRQFNKHRELNVLPDESFFRELPDSYKNHMLELNHLEAEAIAEYDAQSYFGKVVLFKARDEERIRISSNNISKSFKSFRHKYFLKKDNGWGRVAKNLQVVLVEGHHRNIVKGDNLLKLVKYLTEFLY
jgi:amino acid adenylation domain-containing protein